MKRICFFVLLAVAAFGCLHAQTGLSLSKSASTVSQDFDSMWDAAAGQATLTLPAGWRIDRQMNAPRMVGSFADAATTVMYSGGVSLASNASNGTWNWGASATPSDRSVGGLSTTVSGGTRCVSVMTQLTNNDAEAMGTLTLSYDLEKYRKGDNPEGFTVQLYYSANGTSWKPAGDDFKTVFAKDDATAGAEVVPIETVQVSEKTLKTNVAPGASIYLAWNITVSSGTSPNKAMGLALDNVSITAGFGNVESGGDDTTGPEFNPSGIYLRGDVNGWTADAAWEFSDEGNGVYVLYDKELSGGFKVADANWSSACNYGTNGTAITMDTPYALVLGTNDNIVCGYTFDCKRIVLTLTAEGATLLLESKEVTPGEPSVLQEVVLMPADVILVPQLPEQVKVLSLNNSLIHYNDQPAMFNDIAKAMGKNAQWTKHTLLGKPLSTHWNEGDGLAADGNPGAKMMIRSEAWSHIILQEQSGLPRTDIEAFRSNVKQWVSYIREYCPNPNAIIIVPLNWAYSGDWANFSDFNKRFLDNYMSVARETGVTICPVGVAYQQMFDDKGADGLAPWFQDDRHPTDLSTYMAACMEYGLIFGEDPTTITTHPASLSDTDAADMRSRASLALKGFSNIVDHTAATVRLQVVGIDQYGKTMEAPADMTFTLTDGGTLDENHQFVSNGTEGIYTVTAQNADYTTAATIRVAHAETEVVNYPAIRLDAERLSAAEDFNTMGIAADATLPEAWRIDRQTAEPRLVGSYPAAQTTTTYAGGDNLPSNAKNGVWNFGQGDSNDRAVGGISTGVADGTRAVNIYAHLFNEGKKNIENLQISYDVEKYRKGSNPAGFAVQMYYSIDGRNWTSAGADFYTKFEADAATEGYAEVPGMVVPVSGTLNAVMQPGCDFYLAWNISVADGTTCNSAMALAIDNFQLSGSLPTIPTAKHYIYAIDESGYDALGLYAWGDSELFGAWPGEASVDERVIGTDTYKVFLLDAEGGNYYLIFNNWNNGSQLPDYNITANRDYYFRLTATGVEELGAPATGIETIRSEAAQSTAAIFDLQGRRVLPEAIGKGIYIMNGKKFLKK